MKVAVFGKKYNNDITSFREKLRFALVKYGVKTNFIDESYFDTSAEEDAQNPTEAFKRVQKSIFKNDIVIIEATERSDGIGLIAGMCIALRKPVLLLYNLQRRDNVEYSSIALGSQELNHSMVTGYELDKVDEVIEKYIHKAREMTEAKFFINLPAEINNYLIWWAYHYSRPKVDKLRDLLFQDMSQNPDWKRVTS